MVDPALITKCTDPSLKPAIVEQFVKAAGSSDPLAVTVRAGGRLVLVPKAGTPEEAMEIVKQNVGHSVVRVGLTQFPAGVGVKDISEVTSGLVDPCVNLRLGTRMFAKILRIVSKWYGNPESAEAFPQVFEDAIDAWKTGEFEAQSVFQAEDPSGLIAGQRELDDPNGRYPGKPESASSNSSEPPGENELGRAGMRIDLSRILRQ